MSRTPTDTKWQDEAPKLSALAVCSLVFGFTCCIPLSGFVATILGGAAMVRISKSEGRLSGRTLAFIGLALGILVTTLQLAIAVGAYQAVSGMRHNIVEPAAADIKAIQQGDFNTARRMFRSGVTVTDTELQAFKDSVLAEHGEVIGWPKDMTLPQLMTQQPNVNQSSGANAMIPVPVQFAKGNAWLVIQLDPTHVLDLLFSGKTVDGTVTNIGVIGGKKEIWLRSAAPGVAPPAAPKPSTGPPAENPK